MQKQQSPKIDTPTLVERCLFSMLNSHKKLYFRTPGWDGPVIDASLFASAKSMSISFAK